MSSITLFNFFTTGETNKHTNIQTLAKTRTRNSPILCLHSTDIATV